jgi:CheY-like chemotaxis protein
VTTTDDQRPSSPEQNATEKTILVVEDDENVGAFPVWALRLETPYQAVLVTDSYQALQAMHRLKPRLFLLDYNLPYMNGIELYDHLHSIKELRDIPAILISARLPTDEAQKRGMTCIRKPIDLEDLLHTIEKLIA